MPLTSREWYGMLHTVYWWKACERLMTEKAKGAGGTKLEGKAMIIFLPRSNCTPVDLHFFIQWIVTS